MDANMLSEKRSRYVKGSTVAKRKRKAITLEMKLDVLKRYDRGERTADIERHLGLNESTLRTIRDNAEKIRKSCKSVTRLSTFRVTVSRSSIMEKMESLLITWLEEQKERNVHVSTSAVKDMAKRLYEDLKNSDPDPDVKTFTASSGWFERFKVRHGFQKLKSTDENVTAEKFIDIMKTVIEENNYTPKQVFNIGGTGLYWKRLPSKCCITADEKPLTGFRTKNDRLTLLLGGNATGDCKIKPLLVYHEENPKVLKGYSKTHLPVIWRSTKKGLITTTVFVYYFGSQLHQELKAYCEKENLPFKILLLLDVESGYPQNLVDLSNNIRVLFLPARTASVLQPVDQGVTTIFKYYYHRQVFERLINDTETEGRPDVVELWHNFNLKVAVDIIGEAWAEVNGYCMNGAWRKIWPEIVNDSASLSLDEIIDSAKQTLVDMARSLSFQDVDVQDIDDLIESHKKEMSNEDFQKLEEESDESGSDTESIRILSTDVLSEIFRLGDTIISLIDENDPDRERSSQVARDFQSVLACYKELYREKMKHSTHISVERFLIKYE